MVRNSLHQVSLFLLVALSSFFAAASVDQSEQQLPLVQVEQAGDPTLPYKERRGPSGSYLGFRQEQLRFKKFFSITDGKTFEELFGNSTLPLLLVDIDFKYNFYLGSLTVGFGLGQGKLSDNRSGLDRSLSVTKKAVNFKYNMDNIFSEPYVVPYVGVGYYTVDVTEKTPVKSIDESTDFATSVVLGLLLQLNWIDYATSKEATAASGIENTFIDISLCQHMKSGGSNDPDMSTDFSAGLGLRIEF